MTDDDYYSFIEVMKRVNALNKEGKHEEAIEELDKAIEFVNKKIKENKK